MVKPRTIHIVTFRRAEHDRLRAACTCGWTRRTKQRRTFAQLAELIEQHTAANLTVLTVPQS